MKKLLKKISRYLPDKIYLKLFYRRVVGEKLDLKKPRMFGEKIQWLKLNDRNPIYTNLVDKYEVRKYIKEKIGEEYLIPLLGVWNNVSEIDFESLPNQFVLKTTHDSGGVVICKDKRNFDIEKAKKFLSKHLQDNFYYLGREWPYKNVKPRIIAEKYMSELNNTDLIDYKIYCFSGKAKYCQVIKNRSVNETIDFYDENWTHQEFVGICSYEGQYSNGKATNKPKNYDLMKQICEKLSEKIAFVRVDFYEIDQKLYFGELTFYPGCGFGKFYPENWNYRLGDMINLDLAYSKVGSKK